ncbi:hypothetical protein ABK046_48625, partial [Streptomyces caeruleatus]
RPGSALNNLFVVPDHGIASVPLAGPDYRQCCLFTSYMDMHELRILAGQFSTGRHWGFFKLFSLVEFISATCVTSRLGLTQKVIR